MATLVASVAAPRSRFYVLTFVLSAALGALSLLAPSTPSYDPWAWLVWGREVAHGGLDTTSGPAWKPLPVLVTTLLSPLGEAAPDVWLALMRASGLAALVLVGRIAWRAAGGGRPGLVAGVVAAATLVGTVGFARGAALGASEALLVALAAGALDQHLEGRRTAAFLLAGVAALLRPETWPFVAAYGAWLWRRGEVRTPVAAAALAVPALWFLPELWGSGDLLRSSERARVPNPGAPTLADHPVLDVARRFVLMLPPLALGALLARGRLAVLIAGATAAWVALVAAMSELGYSGEERYLLPAAAGVAVLAGAGWARALNVRLGAAALAAVAVATVPLAVVGGRALVRDLDEAASLRAGLSAAIAAAGGADVLRACGDLAAGRYRFPLAAWHLGTPIAALGLDPAPRGVVLRSRWHAGDPVEPAAVPPGYALATRTGGWEVWTRC